MSDTIDIQRARAFGMLLGLAEGLALSMDQPLRDKAQAVVDEAKELWEGYQTRGPGLSLEQMIKVLTPTPLRTTSAEGNSEATDPDQLSILDHATEQP